MLVIDSAAVTAGLIAAKDTIGYRRGAAVVIETAAVGGTVVAEGAVAQDRCSGKAVDPAAGGGGIVFDRAVANRGRRGTAHKDPGPLGVVAAAVGHAVLNDKSVQNRRGITAGRGDHMITVITGQIAAENGRVEMNITVAIP